MPLPHYDTSAMPELVPDDDDDSDCSSVTSSYNHHYPNYNNNINNNNTQSITKSFISQMAIQVLCEQLSQRHQQISKDAMIDIMSKFSRQHGWCMDHLVKFTILINNTINEGRFDNLDALLNECAVQVRNNNGQFQGNDIDAIKRELKLEVSKYVKLV